MRDVVVSEKRLWWIAPIFNIPLIDKKLYLSLGTHVNYFSGKYEGLQALQRGIITYTHQDFNFSVGATYHHTNLIKNDRDLSVYQAISYRFSPRTSVMSELNGYFFADQPKHVGIVGFRTSGKAISFDYGISWPLFKSSTPGERSYYFNPFPWLGFSYRFQTKK